MNNPISTLSECLYSAIYADLKPIQRYRYDYDTFTYDEIKEARKTNDKDFMISYDVRPTLRDVRVAGMFTQTFSSTACGHGGVGGAAMTDAYVVCLISDMEYVGLVYTAGRLLRKYDLKDTSSNEKFFKVLEKRHIPER